MEEKPKAKHSPVTSDLEEGIVLSSPWWLLLFKGFVVRTKVEMVQQACHTLARKSEWAWKSTSSLVAKGLLG